MKRIKVNPTYLDGGSPSGWRLGSSRGKPIGKFVAGWALVVISILLFLRAHVVNSHAKDEANEILSQSDMVTEQYKWKTRGEDANPLSPPGSLASSMSHDANEAAEKADILELERQATEVIENGSREAWIWRSFAIATGLIGIALIVYWVGSTPSDARRY